MNDSRKNPPWMSKPLGKSLFRNRIYVASKYFCINHLLIAKKNTFPIDKYGRHHLNPSDQC